MAELYGVNHTKAYINKPSEKVESGQATAEVRMSEDSYAFDAATSNGDIIKMQALPAGARIVDVVAYMPTGNSSALGGVIDIGYSASKSGDIAADGDAFFDGLTTTELAAGESHVLSSGITAAFGIKLEEEVFVTVTTPTGATATDGSELFVRVFYVID